MSRRTNSPPLAKSQYHVPISADSVKSSSTSSNTSLLGMEQALPPRTMAVINDKKKASPSPNNYKPLPPTPSLGRRISLSPPNNKHQADADADADISDAADDNDDDTKTKPRRSSSIYSRSASAWFSNGHPSPQPLSTTEHPVPKISSSYFDRESGLAATISEPQLLLPRTYSPLLKSPSSTLSSEASPSPVPPPPPPPPLEQRPSALLPLPVPHPGIPKKHLHTISLEKAKGLLAAPGSEHLLPEELTARTIAKAKSVEHITPLVDQTMDKPPKPGSTVKVHEESTIRLPSTTFFEAETWHNFAPRSIATNNAVVTAGSKAAAAATTTSATRWSGSTAVAMSRDTSQSQNADTSDSSVPRQHHEAERGRTMERTARGMHKTHIRKTSDSSAIAAEYSALCATPYGQTSLTRFHSDDDDAESPGTGRLAPQPLFTLKSPAQAPGSVRKKSIWTPASSASPMGHPARKISRSDSLHTDGSRYASPSPPPPPDSFFQASEDDEGDDVDETEVEEDDDVVETTDDESSGRESRTGSIPISHPLMAPPLPPSPTLPSAHAPAVQKATKSERLISYEAKQKARESAYYPYIGKRRKARPKAARQKTPHSANDASLAMSAARAASQTTESPPAQAPRKKLSDVPELLTRVANKAVKAADKLAHPGTYADATARLSQSVTAVYLGWSEESKEDFDASKPISPKLHYAASTSSPRSKFSHVTTPARPLHERTMGSDDQSNGRRVSQGRKPSIFGSLLDITREKGRERRREEIKKTIRVIPNHLIPSQSVNYIDRRRSLDTRIASDTGVPTLPMQSPVSRLGIWGRRISEFGVI